MDLQKVARKALKVCKKRRWSRSWSKGGCYLHLEASELIEALRGKGDTSPMDEAGDVLFVLLSMMEAHGISIPETLEHLDRKMDRCLEKGPKYRRR